MRHASFEKFQRGRAPLRSHPSDPSQNIPHPLIPSRTTRTLERLVSSAYAEKDFTGVRIGVQRGGRSNRCWTHYVPADPTHLYFFGTARRRRSLSRPRAMCGGCLEGMLKTFSIDMRRSIYLDAEIIEHAFDFPFRVALLAARIFREVDA